MSKAEFFDVSVQGTETTVSFSADTLSRTESAEQISRQVCNLIEERPFSEPDGIDSLNLVNLDFSQIDRISSAGLNSLIQLRSRSRVLGFRVKLVNVPTQVRKIFEVTRLERMFELEESAMSVG